MSLERTLNTDMRTLARALQAHGRGHDTILAHIRPEEAALLKARGGRGSINPATGLLEFDYTPDIESVTVQAPAYTPSIDVGSLAAQGITQPKAAGAPAPADTAPSESVTSTANATPTSVTVPDTFALAPLVAPNPAGPPTPAVAAPAAAPAAPEQVTVTAPQIQPTITPLTAIPATAALPGGAAPQAPAPEEPGTSKQVKDFLGNNSTLLSILGLGGLGLLGARTAASSGKQAQQLQQNLAGLAQPLQAAGTDALNTTLAGGLTPQNMQVLQAAREQTSQAQARGAVSSQQAEEAISTTYANLLQTQLQEALTLLNNADQYLQSAYLQGYQANVTNQTNTTNFYTNLAQLAARLSGMGGGTTINLGGATQ